MLATSLASFRGPAARRACRLRTPRDDEEDKEMSSSRALRTMQQSVMEAMVTTSLAIALGLVVVLVVPTAIWADKTTRVFVLPIALLCGLLCLCALLGPAFDLDEAMRKRPILAICAWIFIGGGIGPIYFRKTEADCGHVAAIAMGYTLIIVLNQGFPHVLDRLWLPFYRGFRSHGRKPHPAPAAVSTSVPVAVLFSILLASAAVVRVAEYRNYLDGDRGADAHPSALGKAIVYGSGAFIVGQLVVIENRLRDSKDRDAATTTQTMIKAAFFSVITIGELSQPRTNSSSYCRTSSFVALRAAS